MIRTAVVEGLRLYDAERRAAERSHPAAKLRALGVIPARVRLAALAPEDDTAEAREALRSLAS